MKPYFIFVLVGLLFISSSSLIVSEELQPNIKVERGINWDKEINLDTNIVKKTYYMGAVNIQNESGDYVPFEEYVDVSVSNGNVIISKGEYSVSFMPIFQMKNGIQYYWDDIPLSIGKNLWREKYRGHYKYGVNFYNVPDTIKNNLQYVILHRTGSVGLTWDDVELEGNSIIIKNKIKLSHDDILKDFTIKIINKTDIVIGNLSENFINNGDGTWNISFDPTIGYNFNATYQDNQMKAWEGANDDGFSGCTIGGAVNWGTATVVDIDTSEPMLNCIGTLTNISTSATLDSIDDNYDEHSVDDPPDNGGGYIFVATPSEDKSTITTINWSITTLSLDLNDLWIRFVIYNQTGNNWYQCAPSVGSNEMYNSSCIVTQDISYFFNNSNSMHLGVFGDWDSDPGKSASFRFEYIALTITYEEVPPPSVGCNCTFPNSYSVDKTINMSCHCNVTSPSWCRLLNFTPSVTWADEWMNVSSTLNYTNITNFNGTIYINGSGQINVGAS